MPDRTPEDIGGLLLYRGRDSHLHFAKSEAPESFSTAVSSILNMRPKADAYLSGDNGEKLVIRTAEGSAVYDLIPDSEGYLLAVRVA
jgi:hypothetical protein